MYLFALVYLACVLLVQAPGNKSFIVPRYPSGVRNQRFRWLVIYYPYTIGWIQ